MKKKQTRTLGSLKLGQPPRAMRLDDGIRMADTCHKGFWWGSEGLLALPER